MRYLCIRICIMMDLDMMYNMYLDMMYNMDLDMMYNMYLWYI